MDAEMLVKEGRLPVYLVRFHIIINDCFSFAYLDR